MIFTERFLLPCGRTEEERLAIVREWVRKRRGASGRIIAVSPVKMVGFGSSATRTGSSISDRPEDLGSAVHGMPAVQLSAVETPL